MRQGWPREDRRKIPPRVENFWDFRPPFYPQPRSPLVQFWKTPLLNPSRAEKLGHPLVWGDPLFAFFQTLGQFFRQMSNTWDFWKSILANSVTYTLPIFGNSFYNYWFQQISEIMWINKSQTVIWMKYRFEYIVIK